MKTTVTKKTLIKQLESNFFHIFRNVLRETNDGPALEPTRREWLRLTPSGRYVWSDDQSRAEDIPFSDSCRIVDNLQTHGNPYRFNYGKIWQSPTKTQ